MNHALNKPLPRWLTIVALCVLGPLIVLVVLVVVAVSGHSGNNASAVSNTTSVQPKSASYHQLQQENEQLTAKYNQLVDQYNQLRGVALQIAVYANSESTLNSYSAMRPITCNTMAIGTTMSTSTCY
jgi:cell division protein FtsB